MNLEQLHIDMNNPDLLVSKRQLQRIHMLLADLDLSDNDTKAEIVSEFSAKGYTSSKQLLKTEADALISHLSANSDMDKKQNMRRTLLSLGYKLGWDRKADADLSGSHPSVINKHNVNQWLQSKYSPVKKSMEEMNAQELNKCVTALRQYYKKETA